MTEAEWLACTDPEPMLEFLRGKASDRKLRLFACACCYHLSALTTSHEFIHAVEAAERYADGLATKAALKRARQGVRVVRHGLPADHAECASEWVALWLAEVAASEDAFGGVGPEIQRLSGLGLLGGEDRPCEPQLLKCLFGNPFRPVNLDTAHETPNVLELSRTIYDEQAFDRMAILGDALENAGCDKRDILSHCRAPGPHAKGCWVVDSILGKS